MVILFSVFFDFSSTGQSWCIFIMTMTVFIYTSGISAVMWFWPDNATEWAACYSGLIDLVCVFGVFLGDRVERLGLEVDWLLLLRHQTGSTRGQRWQLLDHRRRLFLSECEIGWPKTVRCGASSRQDYIGATGSWGAGSWVEIYELGSIRAG